MLSRYGGSTRERPSGSLNSQPCHGQRRISPSCAQRRSQADFALARGNGEPANCVSALEDRRAALLANHGVVAFGASLGAARALAEEVENLARQYLALRAAGLAPVPLSASEMEEVAAGFADYARPG